MNRTQPALRLLAATVLFAQLASGQTIWNGTNSLSVSTNWSDPLNWIGGTGDGGMAGAADAVKFFDNGGVAAGVINNVVDAAFAASTSAGTISSWQYAATNGFHTTLIAPGVTLNVGTFSVGSAVNSGALIFSNAITGGGNAKLNVLGASIGITQGSSGRSILDLSGLDNFTANVTTLGVGAINYPAADSTDAGTLVLAKTNQLTVTGSTTSGSGSGVQAGFLIGDPRTTGPSSGSQIQLGQTNAIFANMIVIGARKGGSSPTHSMIFNPALTNANPVAFFRGADGSSPLPSWNIGDDFFASGGSTACNGLANLTGGTVDGLVGTMIVGRGQVGAGNRGTGTLTFSGGTMSVGTLQIGFQSGSTAGNGPGTGTVNVNGTATLVVSTNLELTHITTAGTAAGTTVGTLNLNGGKLFANLILNGGGGTSTLSVTNGQIILTNTIGLPSAAISTFAASNCTLDLTIFAAPTTNVVCTNLVAGGTTNTINVDALPAIGGYPATFRVIKYATLGGAFNMGLGALPASSPAFAGYVTNNPANNAVELVITGGPTPPAIPLAWKAYTNSDWDTTTTNWSSSGNPSRYTDGSPVRFDDAALSGTVSLTTTLGPSGTTVSNTTLAYTFTGSGKLGAGGALTKAGSGTLTLENSGVNDYSGGTTISNGTLQIGSGGTGGNLGSGNVTNNGALIFNRSDNITVGNAISGTGSLTKHGNGTLNLTGSSTFSGATVVNAGVLRLNGNLSGGGLLTNAVGTTLGGNGTNSGPVAVSGALAPGNSAGTFGAGGLTMDAGATLALDVNASPTVGSGVNDLLQVNGNLTLNNNAITINLLGGPPNNTPYRVANYTGTRSGTFDPSVTIGGGSHATATLDYSTANQVNLTFAGFANLKWNSAGSAEWDNGVSQNWSNALTSVSPDYFYGGDSVLFDDEPGVVTAIDLASGVTVLPASVTNDSAINAFTISGAGKITGPASLVKKGDSILTLGTSNDFTGNVYVLGGTLKLAATAVANFALGTTNGATYVTNGASLDISGTGTGAPGVRALTETVVISGDGFGGQGAIFSSAGRGDNAAANITLAGNATLGAHGTVPTGWWNIRGQNSDPALSHLSTGGQPYKLTKVGTSRLSLFTVTVDPALGDIDLQQGELDFGDWTTGLGNPASNLVVNAGATLSFFANNPPGATTSAWNKVFILNGDGATTTVNNRGGGAHTLIGPVTLNGSCVWNGAFTNRGNLGGTGGLIRSGGGTLSLLGTNTYSGDTLVNGGTLALVGVAGISNSLNITLSAGTTLDVSARNDATMPLASGQTLNGNGTVRGSLFASLGSTVSPGQSVGVLTVTNNVVLQGTTSMEIDKSAGTNDLLRGTVSISYGGTLNVAVLSDPLGAGNTFKLFDAASYSGAFTNIVPATPGVGLLWDVSALTNSGTLKVVSSTPLPHPAIESVLLSLPDIIVSGTNGPAYGSYVELTSTNVALPLINWTRVATNYFDASGNFSFTNAVTPGVPQKFYLLQLP